MSPPCLPPLELSLKICHLNGSNSYLFATSDPVAGQLRWPAWKKYVKRLSYPYLIPSIRCDVLALFFHLYD